MWRKYRRRLSFEPLEDRRLLTTITVNTTVDENNGTGNVSLREAIGMANTGDTIDFSVTGTIGLRGDPGFGQIAINKSLTIQGPGSNLLTVKAFDPDVGGTNNSNGQRVFSVDDGGVGSLANVAISGLTLSNGDPIMVDDADGGGAILNRENLTLSFCALSSNNAKNGGAILSTAGTLTINDASISSNNASDGDGGAVVVNGGSLTINRSTIANNSASNSGGGIETLGRPLTIVDSTISGNLANGTGGGIYQYQGSLSITGATISGNSAAQGGAGIFSNTAQTLSIVHSTITGNVVGNNSGVYGGGIYILGTANLGHTIVAGNLKGATTRDDVAGTFNAFYSLIGDERSATVNNVGGSQIGTTASPIDAKLAPLANNGGLTLTHALQSGSPALEAGDPTAVANANGIPQFDQRGTPFSRVADYDGASGAQIDIGAIEMTPALPALQGDYNLNHVVDAADYVLWRKTQGGNVSQPYNGADGDGNKVINTLDYSVWKARFGNTPPGSGRLPEALSDEQLASEPTDVSPDDTDAASMAFAALASMPIVRATGFVMDRPEDFVSISNATSTNLLLAIGDPPARTAKMTENDNGINAVEFERGQSTWDRDFDPFRNQIVSF